MGTLSAELTSLVALLNPLATTTVRYSDDDVILAGANQHITIDVINDDALNDFDGEAMAFHEVQLSAWSLTSQLDAMTLHESVDSLVKSNNYSRIGQPVLQNDGTYYVCAMTYQLGR